MIDTSAHVVASQNDIFFAACLPNEVPQILINREPLTHMNFDIELLGNCDNIINELCLRMGPPWDSLSSSHEFQPLKQIDQLPSTSGDQKRDIDEETEVEEPNRKKLRPHDDDQTVSSLPSTSSGVPALSSDDTAMKFKSNFNKMLSQDIDGLRKMYKPRMQKLSAQLPGSLALVFTLT